MLAHVKQSRLKSPPLAVLQFCVCCIGFQDYLLRYVQLETKRSHITLTLHGYPTIVWFMFGLRFMFIALFCPTEAISDLKDLPWLYYDLGFDLPGFAEEEEREREKERKELEREKKREEAKRRKEEEEVIVDVLVDESGNLVVDEDGEYVTMRIYSMNITELLMAPTESESSVVSSTPIPLTPPPAQVSDPFNPFTGNFK